MDFPAKSSSAAFCRKTVWRNGDGCGAGSPYRTAVGAADFVKCMHRGDHDTGFSIEDTGFSIKDTGFSIEDKRSGIEDTGFSIKIRDSV